MRDRFVFLAACAFMVLVIIGGWYVLSHLAMLIAKGIVAA